MPNVLIVDDSATDRELVSSVLQTDNNLNIIEAVNAKKALEVIRRETPDLVLTDLVMPDMDGLTLTESIRQDYPALPVILMTAHGNEETVVKALRTGAASYVPKREILNELMTTVTGVLEIVQASQQQQQVLTCMVQSETSYVLGNDTDLIQPLTAEIQRELVRLEIGDKNDGVQVAVAFYEAIMNAMYHGNLDLSSDMLQQNNNAFWELAAKRRRQAPYRDRRVFITVRHTRSEAVYIVRDEGDGFNPNEVADPVEMENLDKLSGRGLLLIRTFMSEVTHNDQGNEITMTFRKQSADDG